MKYGLRNTLVKVLPLVLLRQNTCHGFYSRVVYQLSNKRYLYLFFIFKFLLSLLLFNFKFSSNSYELDLHAIIEFILHYYIPCYMYYIIHKKWNYKFNAEFHPEIEKQRLCESDLGDSFPTNSKGFWMRKASHNQHLIRLI